MNPQTILRAYRKTWLVVRRGEQGPMRARRARQRERFEAWLYRWADGDIVLDGAGRLAATNEDGLRRRLAKEKKP
jgi:hypothetical protein